MKKTALLLICGMLFTSATVHAEKNVNVYLNGNALTFDQQPIIHNDMTFVPVRKIFEAFGMEVDWNSENQSVYACNDDTEISMSIDNNEMCVNGDCIQLDAAPFLSGGRAFVPLRAISEALKCKVEWNGVSGSVIIIGGGILKPTAAPTAKPTAQPTTQPTAAPTAKPTAKPTAQPTAAPTVKPTAQPTTQPTAAPTAKPTAQPTTQPTAAPTTKPTTTESAMEQEVFELVNKVRVENGLHTLKWAEDLAEIARAHCADMINRGFFSHTNPDGESPFDRLKNNGIAYRSAAENIAYGQKDAQEVMNSWMNSSGHRANILSKTVKEIGIGAVKNTRGTIYWTQMFVAR